jgi:hypothetical protein
VAFAGVFNHKSTPDVRSRSSSILQSSTHTIASHSAPDGSFAIVARALAIGFAPPVPGWWRPLAITGSVLGIGAFAVFGDGQTELLFEEGAAGTVLSMIFLAIMLAFPSLLAVSRHP